MRIMIVVLLVVLSLFPALSHAENWLGFRGNTGNAVSSEKNLPLSWSATSNVLWSTSLRGSGNSSPVVTSSRVYVTSFDKTDKKSWVIALDRKTGRTLWEKSIAQGDLVAYGPPTLFDYRHNPATPTPCADAQEQVYAYSGTGELVCLDRDGNVVWSRNLAETYGPYDLKFGMGSSPRLWGEHVFVACLHKGPSYVVALDRNTGEEKWFVERNYSGLGDAADAYTSPVILERPGSSPELIVSGAGHVDAYEPKTGRRIWLSRGLELPEEEYARIIASPAIGDGIIVAPSAKAQHAIALRTGGNGDISSSHLVWRMKSMADCPSPTIHAGLMYCVHDEGIGTCVELDTGEVVWKKRIGGKKYHASPVIGDGRVYFQSLEGLCTVIQEGRDFKVLAENEIPGDFYATPAVSNGTIYLRDRSKIYAVSDSESAQRALPNASNVRFEPRVPGVELPANITLGAVSGVAVDRTSRVYVLQRDNPPVLCFDSHGKFIRSWGTGIIGVGHGLAVDAADNVWVTDTGHHTVFQFAPDGTLIRTLGQPDRAGTEDRQFDKPTHIAFGQDGAVFVLDGYGNSRIVQYSSAGEFVKTWGKAGSGPSEFHAPHAAIFDARGRLIVCDRDNDRIQIFDSSGKFLESWAGYTPFGIAQDPQGRIFVSDGKQNRILMLDDQGRVVDAWGSEGIAPGQFKTPHMLAADGQGNLFVAEVGGRRLQKLERRKE